jgi:uncharacterized protein YegP (UPF0339 family)
MEFVIRRDDDGHYVWEARVDGAVVAVSVPFQTFAAARRAVAALKVEAAAAPVYDCSAVSADRAPASAGSAPRA